MVHSEGSESRPAPRSVGVGTVVGERDIRQRIELANRVSGAYASPSTDRAPRRRLSRRARGPFN